MRSLNLDELKIIQLEILNCVADFCDRNDIKYWLDSGTLIGAIRHKGYIPWDDDIDVGMLRPDYDKFLTLFNESNNRFKAYSIENNKDFLYPFCKVLDTHTLLYEPNEKGIKSSVNIDIFVYDNAPDDSKLLNKMYRIRDIYRGLHNIRTRQFTGFTKGISRVIKWIMYPFLCLFPRNYFCKKMAANSKMCIKENTAKIGNFTSIAKVCCDKALFNSFIDAPFEGNYYKVPIGYDEWLRTIYGDYMQLPPEEQRVPHHRFKAYMLEEYDEKI